MVKLDDELALGRQGCREAGAVAPRGLNRPGSPALGRVGRCPSQRLPIPTGRGGENFRGELTLGLRTYDGRGNSITIRIYANDVIDEFCQCHALLLLVRR